MKRTRKKKAAAESSAPVMVADPCGLVDGVLVTLAQIIEGAPANQRLHLRMHAATGLRRAAETYRLQLLTAGVSEKLDEVIRHEVESARRVYLVARFGGTQPEGNA